VEVPPVAIFRAIFSSYNQVGAVGGKTRKWRIFVRRIQGMRRLTEALCTAPSFAEVSIHIRKTGLRFQVRTGVRITTRRKPALLPHSVALIRKLRNSPMLPLLRIVDAIPIGFSILGEGVPDRKSFRSAMESFPDLLLAV
jgi:hypothetical protein